MKVTMIVDSFKLSPVIQYNDPDYDLVFYGCDGAEVNLGLYERHIQHLKEIIDNLSSKQTIPEDKD